ncbi:MAG: dynamin family protein [Firmicutes bacterium]|nr:dynamin family protein [Bacillota bacterium]
MDTKTDNLLSPEAQAGVSGNTEPMVEINPDLEKLRAYSQSKLELASQLRIVREALAALGREKGENEYGELVVKLAEDRFTLAVLGQFKRGKSSLMNAIIGRELLPTGVLPLTSAITTLKYGPVERLVVRRDGLALSEELPVSALADYVTEKGNPSNRKKVKAAYVELPIPFLRRGLEFVDTPGVGSAITANTALTYGFLPECDAVLFVTSVDTPLTSLELEFLKEIREYVDKIFFVVNKTDLVAENERNEVLGYVAETIRSQTGSDTIKVFPVSARLGLAARIYGDLNLYEQSGIKALEEALATFLSGEKSAVFLAAVAQKALRILDDEAAQGAFSEAALQARAIAMQQKDFVSHRRDPHEALETLMAARTKLKALYEGIVSGRTVEIVEPVVFSPITEEAGPVSTPERLPEAGAAPNMAADLRIRGCPVCQYIAKQASEFFAQWQYQIATEERAQAGFAAELGFCPLHTWQLLTMCSPHGASVGFARLAEQIARRLRENSAGAIKGDAVWQLTRNSRNCRVCGLLRQAEEEYIRRLAGFTGETAGRNLYRRSQGVCLRLLGMLIDAVPAGEDPDFLLAHCVERFEEDAEDMRSYALKREALRRNLQNRNEEDAYRRTVIRMVGSRSVCAPWAEDAEI